MKSNILYTILYIFISLIVISCQEDDDYSRKDYNPKGGFTQEDFTIESAQYLKSSTEDVKVVLEFNRLEGKTATFNIEINNIEPAHNANAFRLTTTSESISTNIDTITVGQIDWSQLDCDSSLYVTLNLVSENTEFGTNTESITLTIYKDAAPSLDLGNDIIERSFKSGYSGNADIPWFFSFILKMIRYATTNKIEVFLIVTSLIMLSVISIMVIKR